jgi:hypothetical protein
MAMKGFAGYLVVALLLAAGSLFAYGTGRFERNLAEAQQNVATDQFDVADSRLADAEAYATYARWIPQVGARAERDLATRRAALRYWKKDYASVLPREADPVGAVDAANVDLQLVVANASFRDAQRDITDKAVQLQALDEAIGSYMAVLKNDTWSADAAYNYEYLLRLRGEIAQGKRKPGAMQDKSDNLGEQGAPAQNSSTKKFEIYIPLEGSERTESGEAGKGTAIQKKG